MGLHNIVQLVNEFARVDKGPRKCQEGYDTENRQREVLARQILEVLLLFFDLLLVELPLVEFPSIKNGKRGKEEKGHESRTPNEKGSARRPWRRNLGKGIGDYHSHPHGLCDSEAAGPAKGIWFRGMATSWVRAHGKRAQEVATIGANLAREREQSSRLWRRTFGSSSGGDGNRGSGRGRGRGKGRSDRTRGRGWQADEVLEGGHGERLRRLRGNILKVIAVVRERRVILELYELFNRAF